MAPRDRDGEELGALAGALAFLGDREAFARRFLLAIALAPPPSPGRLRARQRGR